jgi:hypothetical protein
MLNSSGVLEGTEGTWDRDVKSGETGDRGENRSETDENEVLVVKAE